MFQSSMRSSLGSSLFISLSKLLILKTIKIFKKYYRSNVVMWFNISNIDKEINKELPEDDLIEDRNMLERFLRCFK